MDTNRTVCGYDLAQIKSGPIKEAAEYSYIAAAEGSVLLKNEKGTLPLKDGQNVSVFGRIQSTYYKSGTGSGGMVNVEYVTNIIDSLRENSKVNVNEDLAKIYADWCKEHPFEKGVGWASEPWCQEEMPLDEQDVIDAAAKSDVAIVVIGRTAGEDRDNYNGEGSYQLTEKERDMIKKVSAHFDNVCVVLNVGNVIDCAFADEYGVDSLLIVWQGGFEGGRACASVLTGEIPPSGRLTDTIAKDVCSYESDKHFGGLYETIYSEDIYVGYRYFETFDKESVVYPFGFGLNYTEFETTFDSVSVDNDTVKVTATVKNVGNFDGKQVVQVYYSAPQGVLGKPARELGGFAKTKLLKKGESEQVEITFPVYYMASYDDGGYTGNKSCYVLEKGDYKIFVGDNVRQAKEAYTYTLDELKVVEKLAEACAPVKDFDILHPVMAEDGSFKKSFIPAYRGSNSALKKMAEEKLEEISYTGDKGFKLIDVYEGKCTLDEFVAQIDTYDLCALAIGEGMNSPKVTPGTAAAYGGITENLNNFGVPALCCTDGPSGLRLDDGAVATSIPNGTNLACTWDVDLVEKLFVYLGIETYAYNIDSLLGPGMNIHRHPLNGRNFEYFSEDPIVSGLMAGAQTKGLSQTGTKTTIKHFACNNQEYSRYVADSVVSERALREIYLKGFEICVKDFGATSIMTTYNPMNGWWNASNYELNTSILRDEWNYDGVVMTDWWARMNEYAGGPNALKNFAAMVKSQNDLMMVAEEGAAHVIENAMKDIRDGKLTIAQLQRVAKNVLKFTLTTNMFEKFVRNGCKLINPGRTDLDGMEKFRSENSPEPEAVYEIVLNEDAPFVAAFDYRSPCTTTAQIPIGVFVDGKQATSLMANGSENLHKRSYSRSIVLEKGKHTIKFDFQPSMIKIERIDFMM